MSSPHPTGYVFKKKDAGGNEATLFWKDNSVYVTANGQTLQYLNISKECFEMFVAAYVN